MELRIKELCKEKGLTLQQVAEYMGVNRVSLSNSINGNPTIGTLEKIEIFRNGTLVKTFDNPTPGDPVAFSDAVSEKGNYTYTAVATNWSGSGLEIETKTFIGINQPAPPASAMAYETGNMGEVTVEWEPATTYIDGSPLDPDNVTYNIWTTINGVDTKIKDNLRGTSTTFPDYAARRTASFLEFRGDGTNRSRRKPASRHVRPDSRRNAIRSTF